MLERNINQIAAEKNIALWQVKNVLELLEGGATIPFISRYRKEKTGSLDEVIISEIRDRNDQLAELEKRRAYILKSIEEQGKLSPELRQKIIEADKLAILEDLYLPFKPKRRTRATIARDKGLEPLAKKIFNQHIFNLKEEASRYINTEKEVVDLDEALQGARDIIAEWISEDSNVRNSLRKLFYHEGIISSKVIKGKEEEGAKYKDYFDFNESVKKIPSHRMLALRRGEKEMILSLDISPEEKSAIFKVEKLIINSSGSIADQMKMAVKDCYKRLIKPSLETEVRLSAKKAADVEAIKVFQENLKQLLLASPLGQKRVLAIDPGFRTGCKIVCLDSQGKMLTNSTIYPNEPRKEILESARNIKNLCDNYQIEAIAIGNGTASRETEQFIKSLGLPSKIEVVIVNESGASIYSASAVAREEFPDHDLTVRGAVSIGRRLMDPMAELVKIDAKSIGVGQYQHDVDQALLKNSLDDIVISCVNAVGIELNTASKELLSYVSGLGPQLALNIVTYRNENGSFPDRESLRKVARMGEKAYEQCAGFLRVQDSKNPLDSSAVHPERYSLVYKMADDQGIKLTELIGSDNINEKVEIKKYVTDDIGLPTLEDILQELSKPGRDPREQFESFSFSDEVSEMEDLIPGMILPGIVTNITKFGAFVDVGVHQDGLVHISQLSDSYVSDPAEVVKLQQHVMVKVLEVDIGRKRIAFSMKSGEERKKAKPVNPKPKDIRQKLDDLKNKFQ